MGMRLLVDTHVLFWAAGNAKRIPVQVHDAWQDAELVQVSDVSAYEVARKVRLGKFDGAAPLTRHWLSTVTRLGARPLPLNTEHALLGASLDWAHRDPFDRLIAAQSIIEELTLVTADVAFHDAPGVSVLWAH